MTNNQALITELARMTALFQQRAVCTFMGIPQHSQECDRADAPLSSGAVNLVSVPHSKGIS